jgi:hypothetical protein
MAWIDYPILVDERPPDWEWVSPREHDEGLRRIDHGHDPLPAPAPPRAVRTDGASTETLIRFRKEKLRERVIPKC